MSHPTQRFTGIFIPAEVMELDQLTLFEERLLAIIDSLYSREYEGCILIEPPSRERKGFLIHSSQLKGSSNRLLPVVPTASLLRHNEFNKWAEFIQALNCLVFFRLIKMAVGFFNMSLKKGAHNEFSI